VAEQRILHLTDHAPERDPRVIWPAQLTPAERTQIVGVDAAASRSLEGTTGGLPSLALAPAQELSALGSAAVATLGAARGLAGTSHPIAARVAASSASVSGFARAALTMRSFAGRLDEAPALVVAHDLLTLPAGVLLRERFGCPLVYDSHEVWAYADPAAGPLGQERVRRFEARFIHRADAVVTISAPAAALLEHDYGLSGVVVAANFEPYAEGQRTSQPRAEGAPLRVLVQGAAAPGRGYDELIEGWRAVDSHALLIVRSPESRYLAELAERSADLVAAGRVEFSPAVAPSALVDAAAEADVGVIPYGGGSVNNLVACPTKLSQFLHAGIAVLTTPLQVPAEIVRRRGCGVVYDARDPADLVAAVRRLAADRAFLDACKAGARAAARDEVNWQRAGAGYAELLERLLGRGAGARAAATIG
jgi:glycosyltransferase involved in cell wall biosynthesis